MEKLIHQRQNTTLDYLPSEGLSEEMDFNDVFGGPPRRFSMQETRPTCSFGPETAEPIDERLLSSPWNAEKPVFGEEINNSSSSSSNCSAVRRRHHHQQSDDFYGDIFRGDDSYKSPRRVIDRENRDDDVFGWSSPSGGSRIASPSKLSPSMHDEALSVSLPSQFSLPAKPTNAAEFPTFGSRNNHNSNSLSRFSSQANRSSPLSHQSSISCSTAEEDSPPPSLNDHRNVGSDEKESVNAAADGNKSSSENHEFHFSIYKWAARDVPVMMRSRNKDEGEFDSFAGDEAENKNVFTSHERILEEEFPAVEKMNEVKNSDEIVKEEAYAYSLRSRVKSSLRSFLADDVENPGKVKENKHERASVKKTKKIETDAKSEENGDKKSGVKGKIRDFVQKFNQESDSSIKADDFQTGISRSYRWKPVSVQRKESKNKPDVNISKAEEKLSSENYEHNQKDPTFKVEDKEDEAKHDTKIPSYQKNEFSSDPHHRDSRASVENLDDPLDCSFLIQELSEDHQKNNSTDESSEDIKALDAKIHQWSVGKKGNIRSLLSTLQYVLWQGSGWQPIALVDLIESNSVKRAYQRALLRLHPDKLQQKGAAGDHKYIAEKVFDILQEAWDHFNTLGL